MADEIDFLDHLIRENPSQKFTAFKRAFYDPDHEPGTFLDYTINVFKGWYQAIRPTIVGFQEHHRHYL